MDKLPPKENFNRNGGAAVQRYVHPTGNAQSRRKTIRALKRRFPLTPFQAICSVPKQPFISGDGVSYGGYLIVTYPAG